MGLRRLAFGGKVTFLGRWLDGLGSLLPLIHMEAITRSFRHARAPPPSESA